MNYEDEKAPYSIGEPSLLVPAAVEAPGAPIPADRLYRIAALTFGIILLATAL